MRLLGLAFTGVSGLEDGTVAFGGGLNVIVAEEGAASAFRGVVSALSRGRSPFEGRLEGGAELARGESSGASLDVELRDGARVRLSSRPGDPFRAEQLPLGEDRTDSYRSGEYGFVAPLDSRERAELARLSALLGGGQARALRHLEDRGRRHRWWHVVDGPQLVMCGAIAIAVGAFVWPLSRAAGVAAGVVVALATAVFIVAFSSRQVSLQYRTALLRLGVRSADELEQRQQELQALQRRWSLEESWREAWARRVQQSPKLAAYDVEPLVLASEQQEVPCFLVPVGDGKVVFSLGPDELTGELARTSQDLVFVKPRDNDAGQEVYDGRFATLVSIRG